MLMSTLCNGFINSAGVNMKLLSIKSPIKLSTKRPITMESLFAVILVGLSLTAEVSWSSSAILVNAKAASALQFYPTRSAPAQVVALNKSQIPAEITARLTHMPANVGDSIKKGSLIANLDCRQTKLTQQSQQAKYQQLNNQLAFNQRELKRSEQLARKQNIGEADLDRNKTSVSDIKAQLIAQQASLEIAKLNSKYCQITAPFDGVITKKMANIGEMLAIGSPVVELLQTTDLEVSTKIARTDEVSFKQASAYVLTVNGRQYPLQLRSFLPFIENNTRSREARLVFTSESALVGTTGRLQWQSPTPHLPAHLLQKRNGQYGIFIIKTNKAIFIPVEQAQEGRPIPLKIAKHSLVIIEGRHGLVDGQIVTLSKGTQSEQPKVEQQ